MKYIVISLLGRKCEVKAKHQILASLAIIASTIGWLVVDAVLINGFSRTVLPIFASNALWIDLGGNAVKLLMIVIVSIFLSTDFNKHKKSANLLGQCKYR